MEITTKNIVNIPALLLAKWLSFFFLLSICLGLSFLAHGQVVVEGQIQDAETTAPLPFATIRWSEAQGVVSDQQGRFALPLSKGLQRLEVKYVGYEPLILQLTADSLQFLILKLRKKDQSLREVVVFSGENPAHAIIRKAVARRNEHNPQRLSAYEYSSYNQFYLSLEPLSDSLSKSIPEDSLSGLQALADSSYLFFNESFTRHRKQGSQLRQEVLATQTAGISSPIFTAVATDLQPFGFYEDYIPLLEQEYLNPLTPNSFSRYRFHLADRLVTESDTTFVIAFSPRKGSNFRGLEGILYISSQGYALRNVVAENADVHAKIRLQIRQEYQRVEGQWFPGVLKARWYLPAYQLQGLRYIGYVHTVLKAVNLQPEKPIPFSRITNDFAADASHKDSLFWEQVRVEPLNPKAAASFRLLEHNRTMKFLRLTARLAEVMLSARLPVGMIDIRIEDFLRYNLYEGFRPGLGLSTNPAFSKWLVLGAYAGWGFKDEALKYRLHARLNLHKPTGLYVQAALLQDLQEPGANSLLSSHASFVLDNSQLRSLYLERLDSIQTTSFSLGFSPWLPNLALESGLELRSVNPTYAYRFLPGEAESGQTSFELTEGHIRLSYQHNKKIALMGGRELLLGYGWPLLQLHLSRGFGGGAGNFSYTRLEGLAEMRHHWRAMGRSHIQLMAGWAAGNLPYSRLFSLRGSAGTDQFLDINKTFRTMGVHEFTASVYAAALYRHRLGRIKTPSKWVQPEFELAHHAVWSTLDTQGSHLGLELKATEQIYTEAGLQINDLLQINYLDVAYIGLGASLYYRYGVYAYPEVQDNLHYRILFRISYD